MSSPAKHRYTFALRTTPDTVRHALASDHREWADATSVSEAEAMLREHLLSAERLILVDIGPTDEHCADERCTVCYPSSRNSFEL